MALTDLLAASELIAARADAMRAWPVGRESVELVIDAPASVSADQFTAELALTWDEGKTWPVTTKALFDGGVIDVNPDRPDSPARSMSVGPFRVATKRAPEGEVQNPTHYRLTLRPQRGRPSVSVKGAT